MLCQCAKHLCPHCCSTVAYSGGGLAALFGGGRAGFTFRGDGLCVFILLKRLSLRRFSSMSLFC